MRRQHRKRGWEVEEIRDGAEIERLECGRGVHESRQKREEERDWRASLRKGWLGRREVNLGGFDDRRILWSTAGEEEILDGSEVELEMRRKQAKGDLRKLKEGEDETHR